MVNDTPEARPNGPEILAGLAPPPAAHAPILPAPAAPGAVHQPIARPAKRSRHPRSLIQATPRTGISSAPALLELSAATPMRTVQRRSPNGFVPDAQMLFHVLGICDNLMNTTERFLRSHPGWIPIVSQIYISVLWNVMILSILVESSYGASYINLYQELKHTLRLDDCLIPGPLVPFFQSLAAINGPFEWSGDIIPALPGFSDFWNINNFHPTASYARILPSPVTMLDQLFAFSQFPIPANRTTTYATFQWYRNVFSLTNANVNRLNRIGPQGCGSLYTHLAQHNAAYNFWNARLTRNLTRVNAAAGQLTFYSYRQILGFESQNGHSQLDWFSTIATIMSKYAQFFNGSVPLKSISTVGIGAVALIATPTSNTIPRDWLYPTDANIAPFSSNRYIARRDIPSNLLLRFAHADHELEEQAEQYSIVACSNIKWTGPETQNDWTVINDAQVHTGSYWNSIMFRFSSPLTLKHQYHQVISSRYHQQEANDNS